MTYATKKKVTTKANILEINNDKDQQETVDITHHDFALNHLS